MGTAFGTITRLDEEYQRLRGAGKVTCAVVERVLGVPSATESAADRRPREAEDTPPWDRDPAEAVPAAVRFVADALISLVDHKPPDGYEPVEREEAVVILSGIFVADLAYGAKLLPEDHARRLAEEFLTPFAPDAAFLTNVIFRGSVPTSPIRVQREIQNWHPTTAATFDAGVIVVDAHRAGLLWVEDED